jgi:hypothetical protein
MASPVLGTGPTKTEAKTGRQIANDFYGGLFLKRVSDELNRIRHASEMWLPPRASMALASGASSRALFVPDTIVRASEWRRCVSSKPEVVCRNHANLLAFGLEVVGNVIHAVGPFTRRQPKFDEAEARAQGHEARIVAQFGHSSVEQQHGAVRGELLILDTNQQFATHRLKNVS